MRRKLLIGLGAAALVAVFAIGLSQSSSTSHGGKELQPAKQSAAEIRRALAGAPAPLASLHRQANVLLDGDKAVVKARLDGLRGYPVIVNKWASWCGPCRGEFPIFQRVSVEYGKRVAFLGLDAGDNHADAQRFLVRFPVSYPSYQDPNERTAFALGAPTNFPITLFFDSKGKEAFAHQGSYASQADLVRDIRRYALGAGTA